MTIFSTQDVDKCNNLVEARQVRQQHVVNERFFPEREGLFISSRRGDQFQDGGMARAPSISCGVP